MNQPGLARRDLFFWMFWLLAMRCQSEHCHYFNWRILDIEKEKSAYWLLKLDNVFLFAR
jgi:hypothetical protein